MKHLGIQPEYGRIPIKYTRMGIQYMGIQIE